MDWYVDDLFKIYNNEFRFHYENIWYEKIKNAITTTLWWNIPDELFTISSIWTNEKNKSLSNFLNLIRNFVSNIPEWYIDKTWIVEFDTWSNIHAIYHTMWFKEIELGKDYESLITNKSLSYESGLYYLPNMIKECRDNYSQPIREFIKLHWKKMKEILVA